MNWLNDSILRQAYHDQLERRTGPNDIEPNFVDVISDNNGWLPLEVGELMTVSFGDKVYVIGRIK